MRNKFSWRFPCSFPYDFQVLKSAHVARLSLDPEPYSGFFPKRMLEHKIVFSEYFLTALSASKCCLMLPHHYPILRNCLETPARTRNTPGMAATMSNVRNPRPQTLNLWGLGFRISGNRLGKCGVQKTAARCL